MGNMELGLMVGALGIIDIVLALIELAGAALTPAFGLGIPILAFGEFMDAGLLILLPLFLRLRGQSVTSPKQMLALGGTFVAELIPGVGEFPLWILDGLFYTYTIKKKYKEEDAQIAQFMEQKRLEEEAQIQRYNQEVQEEQAEEEQIMEEEEEQMDITA